MDLSNLDNDLLVSDNKHHSAHTYGIDLSPMIVQNRMHKQDKTCQLCCLFAMKCSHQTESNHASVTSKISSRKEKNDNAILSAISIWKTNGEEDDDADFWRSPLFDLPRCFHRNFKEKHETSTEPSLWADPDDVFLMRVRESISSSTEIGEGP